MTVAQCLDAVETQSFGLVLQIGTGGNAQLVHYTQKGFRDIIIVEPNPEYSADLSATAAGYDHIQVINAVLDEGGEKRLFNILNFPEFSTLKDPIGLTALLPGIKVAETVLVDTISPVEVAALLSSPHPDHTDILVINVPGSEADILEAVLATQDLGRFGYLIVRCPREVYFEGAVAGPELTQRLTAQDFALLDCYNHDDPDWPVYLFQRDVSAIKIRGSQKQVKSLQGNLEAKAAALTEAQDQCEDLQSKLDAATQTAQVAESKQKIQHSDLSLALRMQTVARNDQQELQGRYNSLCHEKEKLEQLLIKLTQKLGNAADHLRLMVGPEDTAVDYDAKDVPIVVPRPKATPRRARKPVKPRDIK